MYQVIAAVLAAVCAGIGYLIRRLLRRERVDEVIARRLKLVALHQRMQAAKLDVKALEALEREITAAKDV